MIKRSAIISETVCSNGPSSPFANQAINSLATRWINSSVVADRPDAGALYAMEGPDEDNSQTSAERSRIGFATTRTSTAANRRFVTGMLNTPPDPGPKEAEKARKEAAAPLGYQPVTPSIGRLSLLRIYSRTRCPPFHVKHCSLGGNWRYPIRHACRRMAGVRHRDRFDSHS